MKERREDGASDENVAKSTRRIGTEALSIPFRALWVVQVASSLLHSSKESNSRHRDRIQ